ncbi:MAG: 50S ribosomal protein L18 [Clostridia bacterium]|jgi:large subunit ribosomal protein L18|nr:50S ribosomal protein L18 [Clostridia bacterium]MBQ5956791.1 50S ribosomal protein L18 [Clostridia bacterium]MBQ6004150.1 50S ribosomal protein L18 [Clostridia bacterium]MBR0437758.1 50S ribosomal protein L18 [Clostridia bacterium]MBR3564522.1 50S ribosomal protein L18 [Clostridia bacterium]
MITKIDKNAVRVKRHQRIRNRISGTSDRPRLAVFRSSKNIYAQMIDDENGNTLVATSTKDKAIAAELEGKTKSEKAKVVGERIAKLAAEKGITEAVFDRGGYIYHGRVQALAEGAREAGLKL